MMVSTFWVSLWGMSAARSATFEIWLSAANVVTAMRRDVSTRESRISSVASVWETIRTGGAARTTVFPASSTTVSG